MQEEIYKVHIDDIFEGPMDLLIHLIKKHEVDIYDIPIALITEQYLEYLRWMKAINIDIAGDDNHFVAELIKATGVVVVPGSGFGQKAGTKHFRAVFLPHEEVLEKAYKNIGEFFVKYKEKYEN